MPSRLWSFFRLGQYRVFLCCLASSFLLSCQSSAETPEMTDLPPSEKGREIVIFSLSLLDVGYRFGGKNPEAGLDCSGMVSYVYDRAADIKLVGNAATIAQHGKPVQRRQLRPGDLVFFNTRGTMFSHVGIYLGDGRFIHAPRSKSKVRVDNLDHGYFQKRFVGGRSFF
ncbi:MAG: C40 family peptidase [Burkholderiales bacterium]|nr:C40 family peptidase [Burkholderiales bacterium]